MGGGGSDAPGPSRLLSLVRSLLRSLLSALTEASYILKSSGFFSGAPCLGCSHLTAEETESQEVTQVPELQTEGAAGTDPLGMPALH